MPEVNVQVSLHHSATIAALRAAGNRSLAVVGNEALKDISKHVPRDQEVLRNSGLLNSDTQARDGEFILRWDTPYAQYLWHGKVMHGSPTERRYGPEKLSFTEALARMEWAKYASEVYKDRWNTIYEAAFRRELD